MNRIKAASAVALVLAIAACERTPTKSAEEVRRAEALEKRIAALEQQQVQPSAPGASEVDPGQQPVVNLPAMEAAPAASAPRAVAPARPAASSRRPAVASRSTASSTRAPRPGPAVREPDSEPDVDAFGNPRSGRVDRTVEPRDDGVEPYGRTGDPAPRNDTLVIPKGTELRLVLETALSSATSRKGERVVARVERATAEDGRVVLPGGTVVRGQVVSADAAGRVRGRSQLVVSFDQIVVRGQEHKLSATTIEMDGPASHRRDAAIVGGSTAAGAIIGGITRRGAGRGAAAGAVVGAGAVLATRGEGIEAPAGSRWSVRVKDTVTLN